MLLGFREGKWEREMEKMVLQKTSWQKQRAHQIINNILFPCKPHTHRASRKRERKSEALEKINIHHHHHHISQYPSSVGGVVVGVDINMNIDVVKPAWLERLMGETFFGGCGVHQNRRKNEKNVLCLHCCLSICPHCLPSHRSHPLLQVS